MASVSPFRAASGCYACRLSTLQRFLGSSSSQRTIASSLARRTTPISAISRFSTFRHTAALRKGPAIVENLEDGGKKVADPDDADEPWYLQVEPPKHPTLMEKLLPLPDAPEGSPQIMEPLLKYVYDDLGLDELTMLDLRHLDPPPALGPGLMMIFGTARSERHLHVSADRLVRWLRGRGVSADADGLLGRNELKIRLRRKARKAKMLGNSKRGREADDGISTGWICVNLGTLGSSDTESKVTGEDGRFSGFGVPRIGSTVVVQMFTESRRAELDLETFWTNLARKSEREQGLDGDSAPPAPRGAPPGSLGAASGSPSQHTQRRFFSTGPPRLSAASAVDTVAEKVQAALAKPHAISEISDLLAHDARVKARLLDQMKSYLNGLATPSMVRALRRGELSDGGQPSAFLRLFDQALANLPRTQTWGSRLWLYATARRLGLMEYDLKHSADLVDEMRLSGIDATRQQYADLIQAIFAQPGQGDNAVREQARLAMQVIDTAHERGQGVLSHDLLVAALEPLIRSGARGAEADRLRLTLEHLMEQADLPVMGEELLLRLLDAYADEGSWDRFWAVWRVPPRFQVARSAQMYAYLYRRFAETRHQALCIDAIRRTFQEMVNEEPPVMPRGAVLEALKSCIRIADPHAEAIAENVVAKDKRTGLLVNREFVKLLKSIQAI